MTTATVPDGPVPDLRGWAAAQLDLKPDAAPAEVRAALLRQLPEDDFVPPFRRQQAARLLLAPADGAASILRQGHVLAEEEEHLRTEVDAFAGDFFKLATTERRQRWQELTARCAFSPPLAARVHGLEKGLSATVPVSASEDVRSLAEQVCDLFVSRPVVRAARRQEMVREMRLSVARWQAAARQLRSQAADIAALAPALLDELADWEKRLQQQRKRQQVMPTVAQQPQPTGGSKRGAIWPVILAIFVVINLLRLAISGTGGTSRPPAIKLPPVTTMPRLVFPQGNSNEMSDQEMQRVLDNVHFNPTQQEIDRILNDLINNRPLSPIDRKKLEEWKNSRGIRPVPVPNPAPPDPFPKSRP